jgi:glycosyltransferase involved in cell wall biosynthesis
MGANNFKLGNPDLVSVIIPVHNRFEMAVRAIRSVVDQTYRPIEIIVIDDLSTENFSYPDEIKDDEGISLVIERTNENIGPGAAREIGRLKCKGNYLSYLDSDDQYKPEYLKKMIQYLKDNPVIDMVYCHSKYMSPEGVVLDESVKKTDVEYKHILPYLITHGRPWHSSACVRRRSLTDKIGPWEKLWNWEDYDYDARAGLINNNIGYISEVLCYIDKEHIVKVSKNPDSPKKNRSYGMSICNIARNIDNSDHDKSDLRNKVIYHLMKSAARNLDHGYYKIAQNNLNQLLNWVDVYKGTYFLVHLLIIGNSLKLGVIVSKILRKLAQRFKFI